jgi:hypothetical protein
VQMTVCVLRLLRAKYLHGKNFSQSHSIGGSQFWQGLHAVKPWYERGKGMIVECGQRTRFWEDVCIEEGL